jgi:RNA polymerase sigma-70 factor (ECF subfamily)
MYTDAELIEGCLRGKRSYHRHLYNRYAVKMLSVCMRYIKSQAEAEDVLQEGFINVFLKLKSFRQEGSLEGWIRRIMINTSLMQLRNKIMISSGNENEAADLPADDTLENEDSFWNTLSSQELFEIIHSLPEGYKTVFLLYVLDDFSHKEIAEMLGITEGTSKSQLSRAREMLKTRVVQYCSSKTETFHG